MRVRMVDAWIVGKVEAACHRFQRLTGLTNYWLQGKADAAIVVVHLRWYVLVAMGGDTVAPLRPGHEVFGAVLQFIVIFLWSYMAFFGWKRDEDRAYERLGRGLMNPSKIIDHVPRMLVFASCLLNVIVDWRHGRSPDTMSLFWILFCCHFYLYACDPLPPCKGSIREWLRSLRQARAHAGASA